jgi:hypothetical protein
LRFTPTVLSREAAHRILYALRCIIIRDFEFKSISVINTFLYGSHHGLIEEVDVSSVNGKEPKNSSGHPFAKKDPKPTRARLVSLLDPLGRKRYSEVERFLATVQGATSGLFFFGTGWGWAVRYLIGAKNTLCTLHLLPNQFEASVQLTKEMDALLKDASLDTDLKRRLSRCKVQAGTKFVRLPIKNDHDYSSFKTLIGVKAESLKAKKPAKAVKKEPEKKELAQKEPVKKEAVKSAPVKKEAPKKESSPVKLASRAPLKSR